MSQSFQPRQPKGIPVGGQFATSAKSEAGVTLGGPATRAAAELSTPALEKFLGSAGRRAALLDGGYVPATVLPALTDPRRTAGRDIWWAQSFMAAEHGAEDQTYPLIPDNYTPSMRAGKNLGGRSESGNLRTYRTKWTDDGVTFRMPSRNAINAFAAETGGTFRVPFSAFDEKTGRTIETEALVTNHGSGAWSVDCKPLTNMSRDMVTEAITARLESRRKAKAPRVTGATIEAARRGSANKNEVRSLVARAATRRASYGARVTPTEKKSQWIAGVGYNEAAGVMFTETSNGNTYGHHVDPQVFEQVRGGKSPGAAFNALVKGSPRTEVDRCGKCSAVYATANGHTCKPSMTAPAAGPKPSNDVARNAATAIAQSTAPRVAKRAPRTN